MYGLAGPHCLVKSNLPFGGETGHGRISVSFQQKTVVIRIAYVFAGKRDIYPINVEGQVPLVKFKRKCKNPRLNATKK
jgi:hypothetical protein